MAGGITTIATTTTTTVDPGAPQLRKWMDGNSGEENTKTTAAIVTMLVGEAEVQVETVVIRKTIPGNRKDPLPQRRSAHL